MPSPIFTKKLKETPETKESEEQTDVEIEKTSETEETKQQEEGFIEENPSPSLFSEEKEDPDKIDETEKIRVNGKDKTKDEFHLKAKRVVIYTDKQENTENPSPNTVDKSEQPGEIALIRYSQQSDFRRDIIKEFQNSDYKDEELKEKKKREKVELEEKKEKNKYE
ncbi:hypothetical protein RDABS01_000937 [Bienertia sinuspersici]